MTDMIAVQNLFPLGWEHYLLGGLCIGLGVSLLFVMTGLVGGMSTVFSSTWSFVVRRPFFQQIGLKGSRIWRLEYALGLIVGALLWWLMLGGPGPETTAVPAWQLLVAASSPVSARAWGMAARQGTASAGWARCNGLRPSPSSHS